MQNQNNFTKNAALKSQTNKGQYEYDISLPGASGTGKLNKDAREQDNVGSNQGSVIGNYPEG